MEAQRPFVLIDDDSDDQEIFKHVLNRIGFDENLRQFANCTDALKYLRATNEKPFLIICDINLPEMNGLEFRQLLNEDEYLRKKSIPFVFMSTTAMPSQVDLAYRMTVQGFFIKKSDMQTMELSFKKIIEYWQECIHPNT